MMAGRLRQLLAAVLLTLGCVAGPAFADVRMTFWSRDTSSYFPHAFITLKGTLDATGEVVDTSYGFTLNSLTPVALFASVGGHIDVTNKTYIRDSDAQFQVRISDAQVAAIKAQADQWGAAGSKWNLNKRNCVHFVAEAARRAGLVVIEDKRLMKKPKSFVRSLIALNPTRATVIALSGKNYWAKFPDDETFGVPMTNKDSVLERRMSKRVIAAQASETTP